MFLEVAGLASHFTANVWTCGQEISNPPITIPANGYVQKYMSTLCLSHSCLHTDCIS
jgi:hypothetical protein